MLQTTNQLKPILAAIRAILPISHSQWKKWPRLCAGLYLTLNASAFQAQSAFAEPSNTQAYNKNSKAATQTLPISVSVTPSNNQQQVSVNRTLQVTFDQAINPGAGHFIIRNDQGDSRSISGLDGNRITIQGNSLTINPLIKLTTNSAYTVEMESGALTDASYNPLPAITGTAGLHFTTAAPDTVPPMPLNTDPAGNATEVAITSMISANFNEAIKAGHGNITISNGQGDTQTIAVTDTNLVSFQVLDNNQSKITLFPKRVFQANSLYFVQVDDGAITDLAGNAFAGVHDTTTYTFKTVVDHVSPLLASTNAISAGSSGLTLAFNEPIQAGTGSIILIDSQGNQRSFAIHDNSQVSVSMPGSSKSSANTVTITPKDGLLANSQYTVQLAANVIIDQAGNAFVGIQDNSLVFTTPAALPPPDTTPPRVINSTPTQNQQQVVVSSNITVQFSEAVVPGSGTFIISNGQGDTRTITSNDTSQVTYKDSYSGWGKLYTDPTTIIINPAQDLLVNSQYTVQMQTDTMQDNAGNSVQAATLSFATAADGTPPVILSTTPTNHSQQVALDATIAVQFSEPVKAGGGNVQLNINNEYGNIGVPAQITFEGSNIIIQPSTNLLPNSQYSLTTYNNAITDLTGNLFSDVSDPNAFTFSTITVNQPPPSYTPIKLSSMIEILDQHGFTNVNSGIQLNFNTPVALGSGHLTLSNGLGDTRVININDSSQVTLTGTVLDIRPTQYLLPNAHYALQIDQSAISDGHGNFFASIQDITTLSFNTAPAVAPTLDHFSVNSGFSGFSPDPYAPLVPLTSNLSLTFDEAIMLGSGNITIANGQGDTRSIAISDSNQISLSSKVAYYDNGSNLFSGKRDSSLNTVTVRPTQALLSNSQYYVQLDAGTITDLSGTPYSGIHDTHTILFTTAGDTPAPAASNPVQEVNHGGIVGVYDNQDVIAFNFNVPVTWWGGSAGFSLSQHSFGGNDVVISPDGRSASVTLNAASTIAHGDVVTFNISDSAGNPASVQFTL